jgi:predicted dehydrogenase
MSERANRRDFLKTTSVAGIGYFVAAGATAQTVSKDKVRFGCIGVNGKGDSDSADAGRLGVITAICDVDEKSLAKKGTAFPQAKKFADFREMLEKMDKSIDAVTVSTPDHLHAVAAIMAMKMGKHVYCQKPLTRTVYEARRMGEIAREMKVVTQMGNQGTANDGVRRGAALLRKGVLGKVKEVHVWTNRPIWPQGGSRPKAEPAPKSLNWDLWLGPAKFRPYGRGYHPFAWRGFWAFGTGALGDMACHTMNMPYMGLELKNPTSVVAETSGFNPFTFPKWSLINFEFPANDWRPGLTMKWYDGGKKVPKEITGGANPSDSGCAVVGEKGILFSPNDYGAEFKFLGDIQVPEVSFTKSPGHFEEFVDAIQNGKQAVSNFQDYSGPMTETVVMGNLAIWADGAKVEWDAKNMKVTNNMPEVEHLIKPDLREGYSL